jgi:hypothetical protein
VARPTTSGLATYLQPIIVLGGSIIVLGRRGTSGADGTDTVGGRDSSVHVCEVCTCKCASMSVCACVRVCVVSM